MATEPDKPHQMQTAVNCDTCENAAKHLCRTCQDRLCDRCKDIHSKSKASFDHSLVLLTQEALTLSIECPSHHVCKWHPEFNASIGCQKCQVPVCEKCLIGEHNGHKLVAIVQLFQDKKEKLEQKLSAGRSELSKYESKLKRVRMRQQDVTENKDVVKKEIMAYFDKIFTTLDASKQQLLKSVDVKTLADLNILKSHENILQGDIQYMRKYMENVQNENLQEKIAFFFYTVCATEDTFPKLIPSFSIPGRIKYSMGIFDKALVTTLSGRVFNCTGNIKLLENAYIQIIRCLNLVKEEIVSLAYCSDPEAFWVYPNGGNAFLKYDGENSQLDTLNVGIDHLRNRPICVVDNEKIVLFKKNSSTIYMLEDSQSKLFIDVAPMSVASICPTKDGELLIGIVQPDLKHLAIGRFSLTGECKHYITPLFDEWTPKPLFNNFNGNRLYIDENINGDICLSIEIVEVLRANGDHLFSYEGKEASMSKPFLSRGICTDVLGNILVADKNNRGIHVLDIYGGFLTMFTIPDEPEACPTSLCIDHKNYLCVGCADGKIKILKYLD